MRKLYPWKDWLERPRTVILRGIHYRCSQTSMVQNIRNEACRRGVRIRVVDTNTEITIEVKGERKETTNHSGEREAVPVI